MASGMRIASPCPGEYQFKVQGVNYNEEAPTHRGIDDTHFLWVFGTE
jgi:hypothetical protein